MSNSELAVQFCGFRNVDLFSQGIYQLRVTALCSSSQRKLTPSEALEEAVPTQREFLLPAHILAATDEYCTPSFRVRYCEEELPLRTLVRLKAANLADGEDVVLIIKLMHAKSTTVFDMTQGESVEDLSARHFNVAATQRIRLTMPLPTVSAFYPITFSDWHFSFSPLLLHTLPLALPSSTPPPQQSANAPAAAPIMDDADAAALASLLSDWFIAPATAPPDFVPPPDKQRATAALHRKVEGLLRAAFVLSSRLNALDRAAATKSSKKKKKSTATETAAAAAAPATEEEEPLLIRLPEGVTLSQEAFRPDAANGGSSKEDEDERSNGIGIEGVRLEQSYTLPYDVSDAENGNAATTTATSGGGTELLRGRLVVGGGGVAAHSKDMSQQIDGVLSRLRVAVPTTDDDDAYALRIWAMGAKAILTHLDEQMSSLWERFLTSILKTPDGLLGELADHYGMETSHRLGETVFREVRLMEQLAYVGNQRATTSTIAQSLRASTYYQQLVPPYVRDAEWDSMKQPVLFEHRYAYRGDESAKNLHPAQPRFGWANAPGVPAAAPSTASSSSKPQDGTAASPPPSTTPVWDGKIHVLVFVHGFHGNSYDLRCMRDHLALMHPHKDKIRFLCSSSNEEHTAHASFEQMGQNLAKELLDFLVGEKIALDPEAAKISFACHSFGSIVTRVALSRPDLEPLLPMLHTYLSFSGPHLGMLYSSNALVEIGMWGLRRWKGAQCLTELSLKDAAEPTATLLYRLSKQPTLGLFTNVLLISSAEDRYVPHHSARIQLCDEAVHDPKYGAVFISMVHNLIESLSETNLIHLEVHFGAPPTGQLMSQMDAAIGRTAHISFLDSDAFVSMFVHMYCGYFV